MIRGLYTAGTGMISQMNRLNVITNNLVNATTAGFKEDLLLTATFEEAEVMRLNDSSVMFAAQAVGPLHKGVHVDSVHTRFGQGPLQETGNPTDIAIDGSGFFVVTTPEGERLTRDGAFSVDSAGRLVCGLGYPVLGEGGEIYIGEGTFSVNENGEVSTGGAPIDKILIVNPDTEGLRKEGGNLYFEQNPENRENDTQSTIKQGFLEGSNVDLAMGMVKIIEVYRNYESNQRVAKMLDETLGRAVNDLGQV